MRWTFAVAGHKDQKQPCIKSIKKKEKNGGCMLLEALVRHSKYDLGSLCLSNK